MVGTIGFFGWTQVLIGSVIALGGYLLLVFGVDKTTPPLRTWLVRGLSVWGAWFALVPFTHRGADSLSAQALALLVASLLIIHGRRIKGILDDEWWWHEGRGYTTITGHFEGVRTIPPSWKRNPLWAILADDSGRLFGPSTWSPAPLEIPVLRLVPVVLGRMVLRLPILQMVPIRASTSWRVWRSIAWWREHLFHNFAHYVIGIADRERLVEGRYGPASRAPGGGWLTCITHVEVGKRIWMLPFVSYQSGGFDFEFGWHPSGAFTVRFHNLGGIGQSTT